MGKLALRIAVVSHAGVKRINRSVYALLKNHVDRVSIIVPSRLALNSETIIYPDPAAPDEAEIVPLALEGSNPRKYFYPRLIQWLDENKPKIILLENDPASKLGLQMAGWAEKHNARLICQTYDNIPRGFIATKKQQGFKAIPKNLLIHLLNYRMASKVHALLVVNRDSEAIFSQYSYPNIVRTPLGYDRRVFFSDEDSRMAYRSKLGIDTQTVLISYFGRLVHQKGVHLLVQALGQLKNLKWKLLLDHNHGREDLYSSYISDLINNFNVDERVLYFDADHYEIANYMRASDIMVAPSVTTPSFKEQYGRAVQEAMACGCVSIVSDSGHLKDLVGDMRLVFREGDADALKDILADVIQNTIKRQEYRSSLIARAEKHFAIDTQMQRLMGVIQQVCPNSIT